MQRVGENFKPIVVGDIYHSWLHSRNPSASYARENELNKLRSPAMSKVASIRVLHEYFYRVLELLFRTIERIRQRLWGSLKHWKSGSKVAIEKSAELKMCTEFWSVDAAFNAL